MKLVRPSYFQALSLVLQEANELFYSFGALYGPYRKIQSSQRIVLFVLIFLQPLLKHRYQAFWIGANFIDLFQENRRDICIRNLIGHYEDIQIQMYLLNIKNFTHQIFYTTSKHEIISSNIKPSQFFIGSHFYNLQLLDIRITSQSSIIKRFYIMANRLNQIKKSLVSTEKHRLAQIRQRSKLDAGELRDLLFLPGNYEKYIAPTISFIQNNKNIFTHHNIQEHNRPQQRKESARMIFSLMKFLKIDIEKDPLQILFSFCAIASFDQGIVVKALLHYMLYIKTILLYQSNEKHKVFLNRAMNLEDLGCFGLTEFHHGSYSKGLQTLAIYNHYTKEFVITSQGTKGMKYWIGAAAEIANMSIIWAQVIVDGKSYGPHPFIVQIRDHKTHHVLPGITIGDCGPKAGVNYLDNGYIIFDNLKIPKDNLLGKLGDINANGKYLSDIKDSDVRFGLHMSPLSGGRGIMTLTANVSSINALTIALRYACGRKQFDNSKKTDEILIIDYSITKVRILPHLARSIIQMFAGAIIGKAYCEDSFIFSNLKYIAELHALSASVKARVSENCTGAINDSRSILGGHGYSTFSRISSLYHDSDVNNTWQGDNNMLLQQTSKYLMKVIAKKQSTQLFDLSFVHRPNQINADKIEQNLQSLENVQFMVQDLFRSKYFHSKSRFEQLSKKHKDIEEVWYYFHSQVGNALAIAYADAYIFTIARKKIQSSKSPQNKQFLTKLLFLWAFNLLEKERYGTLQLRKQLQKRILKLCDDLVDQSVVACDILAPSSFIIGSPFADYEGNGFKEYLNLIYASKDTFRRPDNFEEIVQLKKEQTNI